MSKHKPVHIVRLIADFLHGLSESEIDDLLRGRAELAMRKVSARKKHKETARISDSEMQEILDELYSAETREAGFKILDGKNPNKRFLETLARFADLPVRRRDKVVDLKERIIESTIGYRLRSQAIQGTPEKAAN